MKVVISLKDRPVKAKMAQLVVKKDEVTGLLGCKNVSEYVYKEKLEVQPQVETYLFKLYELLEPAGYRNLSVDYIGDKVTKKIFEDGSDKRGNLSLYKVRKGSEELEFMKEFFYKDVCLAKQYMEIIHEMFDKDLI